MRDHQIDLRWRETGALNRRSCNRRHGARGIDVGLCAIHLDQRISPLADAARDPECIRATRIRRELKAERPWSRRSPLPRLKVEGFKDDRPRAVTEEDAGGTITPVNRA